MIIADYGLMKYELISGNISFSAKSLWEGNDVYIAIADSFTFHLVRMTHDSNLWNFAL